MCLSGIHFSLLCSRSGFWAHEDEEQRGAVQVTRVLRRCSEGGGVGCPRPRAAQCRGEAKTSRLGARFDENGAGGATVDPGDGLKPLDRVGELGRPFHMGLDSVRRAAS